MADRLITTHPDMLRDLLATFIHTLVGALRNAGGSASASIEIERKRTESAVVEITTELNDGV